MDTKRVDAGVERLAAKIAKEEAAATIPGGPNLAPQWDLVLVQRVRQEKSEGGVILPETAQDQAMCLVVEVGPGRITDAGILIPMAFQPGQLVLVSGNAQAFKIDRDHVLVRQTDIVGVWRQGPREGAAPEQPGRPEAALDS